MGQNKIATRIDVASMSVFAKQILEMVGDARSIALHDTEQNLIWAGPGPADADLWSAGLTSAGKHTYAFDLNHVSGNEPIGTLSILSDAVEPASAGFVYEAIEPIVHCIERQIDINTELSAVRRVSEEGRIGMGFLIELDELDIAGEPEAAIRTVLERSTGHFEATFAAALLPGHGIQVVHPLPSSSDDSAHRQLMTMLGSLMSRAKLNRKIARSKLKLKSAPGKGSGEFRQNMISLPIIDSKDEVVGVFVIVRRDAFSVDQVRLCRAISAKLNALKSGPTKPVDSQFSRQDFLRFVAGVMQRDPNVSHAVVTVDIDKLHVVNDNFGHMAGDAVIRAVEQVLTGSVRQGDALTCLGGDVFGLFLRGVDKEQVESKADHILQSVAGQIVEYDGKSVSVTASIGAALIPEVVSDAQAALSTAEVAARSAKGRGGNRLVIYRDLDASVVQRRSDLDQVSSLQSALLDDRFVLYAQPIKSLQSEETAPRYEILVRMLDEQGNVLGPNTFLSAAERYQMMAALDRWVVRKTLDQLSAADNPLEISLGSFSINVSAQSLADKEFLGFVEAQIAESGVPPDALCFEITETSIMRCLEGAQYFISRLRSLGCRLALDDFGTGYCSFAYLKDLRVHYVKIDGVFIRDILENPLSNAIVASLTSIAEVMPAAIVAEHVESDLVIQRLRQHGVGFAQGFGIGRPEPLHGVLSELGSAVDLLDVTSRASVS